ncbi:MAG: SRPBCC family protein [Synechococcus sp.]
MTLTQTCSLLTLERALVKPSGGLNRPKTAEQLNKLRSGEILMDYHVVSGREAKVQVNVMLNRSRRDIWQQLTDYDSWPALLPNIVASTAIDDSYPKRIRQAAGFQMFGFVPQVHIELLVREQAEHEIVFEGVSGSFNAFQAVLTLQECEEGVLLTYSVTAELLWPMPKVAIEQGILKILPRNLKHLRAQLREQPQAA